MLLINCSDILVNTMENRKETIERNLKLRPYLELINKIAKVEYMSLNAQHLVEYDELVNIGIQTVNILCVENSDNKKTYNSSYVSTAIKWAIRNEMRRRYRWYETKSPNPEQMPNKSELREIIYKTILSTDEIFNPDRPFEVKDSRKTPEESYEFDQLSSLLKDAVNSLPRRERELVEAKFFKEKKLQDLAKEFSISPSRISRIIKSGLDKMRDYLVENGID